MNIKLYLKKIISIILTASFMLSVISSTVYAGNDLSSNAQGNNGSSAATVPGGDFGVDDPPRIGLRFSIINGDPGHTGEVISKNVVDYWFMTKDQYNYYLYQYATSVAQGGYYTGVKTQPYTAENKVEIIRKDSDKHSDFPLNTLTPTTTHSSDWAYHDGVRYLSEGKEYVEWLSKDAFGNASGVSLSKYTESIKGAVNTNGFSISPRAENATGALYVGRYKVTVNYNGAGWTVKVGDGVGNENSSVRKYDSNIVDLKKQLEDLWQQKGKESFMPKETLPYILCAMLSVDKTLTDEDRAKLIYDIDQQYGTQLGISVYTEAAGVFGVNESMTDVDKDTGDVSKKAENDVITMTQEQWDGRSPILKILCYTPKNADGSVEEPYLATPNLKMVKVKITQNDGSIVEREMPDWENNPDHWILLVEPLFMLTIMDGSGKPIIAKQAGTITNLAQALHDSPIASRTDAYLGSSSWMNRKAINQALWGAFTVQQGLENGEPLKVIDKDTGKELYEMQNPFFGLTQPATSTRSFASMYGTNGSYNLEGYGVCMWWAGNISGQQEEIPVNRIVPGVDDDADYNIISFYEDTSGKTVKGRVDQLNVPRDTIVSTDGLKEWKITKEPPTNALKFNETPSGRSGSGTPPAPNADENTLYLLYEIDDNVIKLHQDELAHTYKMSDLRGLVHTHNDI